MPLLRLHDGCFCLKGWCLSYKAIGTINQCGKIFFARNIRRYLARADAFILFLLDTLLSQAKDSSCSICETSSDCPAK